MSLRRTGGFDGQNYSELKHAASDLVADYFRNFRESKAKLLKKPAGLNKILDTGMKMAQKSAGKKIIEIKERLGLAR